MVVFVSKSNAVIQPSGKIKARDLVTIEIARGKLKLKTLSNRDYIHSVQTQLDFLNRN
jgi:hypothetical protein